MTVAILTVAYLLPGIGLALGLFLRVAPLQPDRRGVLALRCALLGVVWPPLLALAVIYGSSELARTWIDRFVLGGAR